MTQTSCPFAAQVGHLTPVIYLSVSSQFISDVFGKRVYLQEHPLYSVLGVTMVHFGETEHEESHGLELGVGWICESSF